jgi:hypothetical protein
MGGKAYKKELTLLDELRAKPSFTLPCMVHIVSIFKLSLDAILTSCCEIVFNFMSATTEEIFLRGNRRKKVPPGRAAVSVFVVVSQPRQLLICEICNLENWYKQSQEQSPLGQ